MMFNLLIALVMIYVVMAAVFESLLFPAAIMSGVLFSVFGVFWLFWLTGTEFNIMAFIGILVLMGVVVNNGIVMIEHINNLRRRGMSRTDALVEGSRERLRPILMTMGTAILAMVPIALSATRRWPATARRTTRWRARSPVAWRSRRWSACCSCRRSTRSSTTCATAPSRVIARARGTRRDGGAAARPCGDRAGGRLHGAEAARAAAAVAGPQPSSLPSILRTADPHADRGAEAGQEEVEQHARDAVALPAAQASARRRAGP